MKICLILASKGFAGLEKHAVDLCNQLAARGHDIFLFAEQEYIKYLDQGVTLIPLALGGSRYNPVTLAKLLFALRRCKPDVVHAQANKAAAMLNIIRHFVPGKHVATLHSRKNNVSMYSHFDHVIAVSQAAAQSINHDRVSVVYNGIDPTEFVSRGKFTYLSDILGSSRSRPVAVAIGRLVKVKAFDVLIQAWQKVDADLIIAGEGAERSHLENLVDRLGLKNSVYLPGYCDDIASLMSEVDLVVISSRREGFPYVLVEALHAKKPLVSTRVPGAIELLPESVLVPCENPDALHDCIVRVFDNPCQVNEDFQPVWEYAGKMLTMNAMVSKTEEIYRTQVSDYV